jgi:hypothetical protein
VSSDRWEKLQEILIAALQCEPGERRVFACQACCGDASLQAEVESLLSSEKRFVLSPGFHCWMSSLVRRHNRSARPPVVQRQGAQASPQRLSRSEPHAANP